MDAETHRWLAIESAAHPSRGRVLEVGSLNVNGTARDLFAPREYVGLDMRDGYDVDVIGNARCLPFRSGTFWTVLSTSHLEHDDQPWVSAAEMVRVLHKHGRLIVAVPGFGWPMHDHPSDYWRFSRDGIVALFRGMVRVDEVDEFPASAGTMVGLVGRKL